MSSRRNKEGERGASSFASSSSLRSSALRVNTTLLKGEQLHTFPRLLSGWSVEQENYARGPAILGDANKGATPKGDASFC